MPTPVRTRAIQRTLGVILVLNALVVGVKVMIAFRTGSLTVIGASIESALDALNNVIAMVIVGLAARGPDDDHPYGHDKFETLGALLVVGFLSISCFELIRAAAVQLMGGTAPHPPTTAEVLLLAATGIVNIVVVWYERRRGKALNSPLLMADAAHTAGDLFVTALALGSLLLVRTGYAWADPLLSIGVAGIIAWSGIQILRVTVPVLVDERGADAERIRRAVCEVPGVSGAPTVRSRTSSSGTVFADVTITVGGALSVAAAHEIADAAEEAVRRVVGTSDVTVHVEPS